MVSFRLACCRSLGEGIASSLGSSGQRMTAVTTESTAVTALTVPSSQYAGTQRVRMASQCVVPQARMKAANRYTSHLNDRSRRRWTNQAMARGIE
jgi:hypothetical protein